MSTALHRIATTKLLVLALSAAPLFAAEAPPAAAPAVVVAPTSADIYKNPAGKKILSQAQIFQMIISRSKAIKQVRETLERSRISYSRFYSDMLPAGAFTGGTAFSGASTLQKTPTVAPDGSTSEGPEEVASSSSRTVNGGIAISSKLPAGLSYGLSAMPSVSRTTKFRPRPAEDEPVYDVQYNATLGVELIKGSVFVDKRNEFEVQSLTLSASELDARGAFIRALNEGMEAFLGLARQDLQMAVTKTGRENAQRLLEETKSRRSVGDVDKFTTLQAELQYAQSELSFRKAVSDYAAAKEQIREKLGLDAQEFEAIYPDLESLRDMPARPKLSTEEQLKTARASRPDWLKARNDARRAGIAEKRAHGNLLPQLGLTYNHGWTRSGEIPEVAAKEALDYKQRANTVSLILTYPLWGGGERDLLREAESTSAQAKISADDVWAKAELEIRNLIEQIEYGYDRLELAQKSRVLAVERSEAEALKYRVGDVPIKNVVDAQKDAVTAFLEELSGKMELINSLNRLRAATGKLPDGVRDVL